MTAPEPGLDRHEWESEFASIEPDLHDDPIEALPELAALVVRTLEERGYDLGDPVVRAGEEREVVAEYLAAREVPTASISPRTSIRGDAAAAVNDLRAIYDFVIAELEPP
jgi:hypothetical protein